MIIKSNIEAMQTYLNLGKIDSAFNKSLLKVSSGLELPKPEFGGGYFAIANDMEALYKEYTTGVANVQDGIGFLEVAQTTMLEVNDMILRLTELAQRAATETLNDDQRNELNAEYVETISQISNLFSGVKFNDLSVWVNDGTGQAVSVVYGENRVLILSSYTMDTTTLFFGPTTISTVGAASVALDAVGSGVDAMSQLLARMGGQIAIVQAKANIVTEQAVQEKAMEARINELDFAKEMKNFTSLQVVLQASNAMVAQANMKPQMVLQLFGQ